MKAVVISKPHGEFEVVERPIPEPGNGQVVLKVLACGLCHGDKVVKDKEWPIIQYPRIPGHEVIGLIHSVGREVDESYKVGMRFGVGWDGGHCSQCVNCTSGFPQACEKHIYTGITIDGGMAEYALVRQEALVRIPDNLDTLKAAPFLCAGLTMFHSLKSLELEPCWIAIQGMGGLGALGIQYAKKLGHKVLVLSTSSSKKEHAISLGADAFIDITALSVAEMSTEIISLTDRKGIQTLMATAPANDALAKIFPCMAFRGIILILAAFPQPLSIDSGLLLAKNLTIKGFTAGSSCHNQNCVDFSATHDIQSLIEVFSPEQVNEAYEKMMSGSVRFRGVVKFE